MNCILYYMVENSSSAKKLYHIMMIYYIDINHIYDKIIFLDKFNSKLDRFKAVDKYLKVPKPVDDLLTLFLNNKITSIRSIINYDRSYSLFFNFKMNTIEKYTEFYKLFIDILDKINNFRNIENANKAEIESRCKSIKNKLQNIYLFTHADEIDLICVLDSLYNYCEVCYIYYSNNL